MTKKSHPTLAVALGVVLFLQFAGLFSHSAHSAEPKPPVLTELKASKEAVLFNGKDLSGWKVLGELSFEKHGPVVVEKGEIRIAKGKPGSGIVWKGELPTSNYEISLDAKRTDGEDFFCGLTFPVGKEHCTLVLGGWGGKATGLSDVEGMSAIENETTGYEEFKPDQWYRVRLRVSQDKIEAWVDKNQLVDLKSTGRRFSVWWEQEPARPLGIATWYTSAAVRDIRFRRLEERP